MTAGRSINSQSHHWGTPRKYIDAVKEVFIGNEIQLDPCSNEYSIVKALNEYKLPSKDGLKESWDFKTIYVNPPYGIDKERKTSIKHWIKKCHESRIKFGSEIIALVPVATNTSHWKNYIWISANSIAFLNDTRLKFLINGQDGGKGAPMSCAMIYWGDNYNKFNEVFSKFGAVFTTEVNKKYQKKNSTSANELFDLNEYKLAV